MKESRHNSQSNKTQAANRSKKRTARASGWTHNENQVASFLNHLPGFVWMKDLKGGYVYANSALQNLKEYRDGYIGLTDADLWPQEIAETYRANDQKVIAERKPLEILEPYLVNGERHSVLVSKFPIFDKSGAVIMVGGSSIDVTAQAKSEERLREYERVVEGVEEMIAVVDRDYRYLVANEAFLTHRALTREQVVGRFVWEVLDKDVFEQIVKRRLDDAFAGKVMRYEMQHCYPIIGLRELLISYFPVEGSQGIDRVACILQDITDRKQASEALHEAERHYRDIFENAGEGIFQSTPDGRYIAANPALARMHGFDSPEELIRERTDISRDAYADPERREEFKQLLESNGFVREFEFQLSRKDESKISVSVNARVVRDENGVVKYYEGTARDITERKTSQEALRQSEERYRDLVENSTELICTHDLSGLVLSANPAAGAALGYDLDEFVGKSNIRDILAPEVRHQFNEYMTRLRDEGATTGIMFVQTKSGERRIWEYHNSLRTEGVTTPIVRGMARDITEERRVQKALHESEERYRELFENSRDAIYVHDLAGRYVSVNHAAEILSGFMRDEILGRHYSNFITPKHLKNARESFCIKLDAPIETTYEAEIICKNGKPRPVEVSSRMIYKDGVAIGVQGTARDITERRRAQEVLQTYSRRLLEAQEAERQNIARELHDEIGQILTAVSLNLHSIQKNCQTDVCLPNIEESLQVVEDALSRVRELSLELRPSLLDDLGLAAALRWYVGRYTARSGITTEIIGDADVGRISHEVETACFRIVQEALTNTARHSRATRASINIERTNGYFHLTVTDNGIGFDSDQLLYGMGSALALGLRGMQERALAVKGHLQVTSKPGQGTEVTLDIPIAQ